MAQGGCWQRRGGGRRLINGLWLAVLVFAAAGCTYGPTPYEPANRNGFGYKHQALDSQRYRVTFAGNSVTPREVVENYLLYRAAELTLETGNDYFLIELQDTERTDRLATSLLAGPHPRFNYFIYGPDPFGTFYSVHDFRVLRRYQAVVIIQVFKGTVPEDRAYYYDARDVLETLGPTVRGYEKRNI